jgi:hypothetical protein
VRLCADNIIIPFLLSQSKGKVAVFSEYFSKQQLSLFFIPTKKSGTKAHSGQYCQFKRALQPQVSGLFRLASGKPPSCSVLYDFIAKKFDRSTPLMVKWISDGVFLSVE